MVIPLWKGGIVSAVSPERGEGKMSVRSGKVCNDCNHCIRERDNYNVIVCKCEVHDMYLSYESISGGCCKHWEKPKEAEGE